ncbi:sugar-binding transcriptional regulator [Lactiplantibacillus pentosus]|jgi:deoxyribonucleoside regulator|uniref:sugar-binding transcriptional regulator n=1 Tax=Lactiplantibacillus pentosus TaxID=1589 RepID=UPI001CFFE45B|nr:sugar-binding transcriptional regulator [Lactiplantibacillus pentosus]MCB5221161.1 sugar-binding transcriptional regulator [Lactiplantibacillus pentosus]MCT3290377.1 sugar-binding transcriptional regulator [Lactiplantibacillus pentosus]
MEKAINQDKVKLALKVCHLYYEDGLSQSDIGKQLQISRPTISRLLSYAKDTGLVKIEIADPLKDLGTLAQQLEQKYHLKKVLISFDASNDSQLINEKLGELTADYLQTIVQDHDSIGISWGKTIKAVADHLHISTRNDVRIVQLKGSVAASDMNNFANDIVTKFSAAYHTNAVTLPLPVIFDDPVTKKIVLDDRFISQIIKAGEATNIALFTSGTVRSDAMLFNLGYLNATEIKRLQSSSVGDIVSRFITKDGTIADSAINARTVGIQLEALKHKKYAILVAGSSRKVPSIHGALIGGYANVLITDSQSATALLAL